MARKQILKALFLLLLASSFNALAGTVVWEATGQDVGGSVTVHYDGADQYTGFGGLMGFERTGGDYAGSLLQNDGLNFSAFCLDVENAYAPGEEYSVSPLSQGTNMGQSKANDIGRLMNNVYPNFTGDVTAYTGLNNHHFTMSSDQTGLAIQIAIWEIVHEGSGTYDVFDGDISFTDDEFVSRSRFAKDARETAQHFLDQWVIGQNGPVLEGLRALTIDGPQDLLVQVNAVPVPAAVWLFGSAFAGLIGFGKRRQKRS